MKYKRVVMGLEIHKRKLLDKEAYTIVEVIDDAISIIKLHRPEKPIIKDDGVEFLAHCPNCGYILWDSTEQICSKCTQVIDWRNNNDE